MADPFDIQGPSFTIEPPHHLEFTNIVDNHVDCVAKGSPPPKIEWLHLDNTPVTTIPRVSNYECFRKLQRQLQLIKTVPEVVISLPISKLTLQMNSIQIH